MRFSNPVVVCGAGEPRAVRSRMETVRVVGKGGRAGSRAVWTCDCGLSAFRLARCRGCALLPSSPLSWMAARWCRISVVVLRLPRSIRASGVVESALPSSGVAPEGRCQRRCCIRRHRRPDGRDWQRAVPGIRHMRRSAARGRAGGGGRSSQAPHPRSARPNKRLHPAPRLGQRGIDLSHL